MCREQRVLAGLLGEPACGAGHSGRVGEGAEGWSVRKERPKKVMLWELVGWDPLQLSSRRPLTLSPGS